MTQIVSISASTAAIAIEALRPGRRVSAKDQAADIKADAERNARRLQNAGEIDEDEFVVHAPTVSIDVLTTGQQPRQQATFRQAQSAYRDMEE